MSNTRKLKIVCVGLAAVLLMGVFLYTGLYYMSTRKGNIEEKIDVAECDRILEEAGTPSDIVKDMDSGFKQYLGEKMQDKKESFQYYGQKVPFAETGDEKLYLFTTKPQLDYGRERARIYIYLNWQKSSFSFSDDVLFDFELFSGWEISRDTPEFMVDMYNKEGELMECDRYDLWALGSNRCKFRGSSMSVGKRSFKGFTNMTVENVTEIGEEPATTAISVQFKHNDSSMPQIVFWKDDEQIVEGTTLQVDGLKQK